jgi:hypothetical protein
MSERTSGDPQNSNAGSKNWTRRRALTALGTGGFALTGLPVSGISLVTASTSTDTFDYVSTDSTYSEYGVTDVSDWEYVGPVCPTDNNTDESISGDSSKKYQKEWTEGKCTGGNYYQRDITFDPNFYLEQHDSITDVGPVGIYYEANLTTTVTHIGCVDPTQTWKETPSGKWATDFSIHNACDMIDATDEDYGDPMYWIDQFNTIASLGEQNAYIHSYKNIHDPEDWVGATSNLDKFQDYDPSDYAKETAKFLAELAVGRLRIIGSTLDNIVDIAKFTNTLHNMLSHDPTGGQTETFEYDFNATAEFSALTKFRLSEMGPGQEVTIDIEDAPNSWIGVGNVLSFSAQAPNQDPNELRNLSVPELRDRGIKRYRVGDIRQHREEYYPELADDEIIHMA